MAHIADRESLRNMINTMPYPVDMENLQWRVKNIYDSCMAVGVVESEEERPLKKMILHLGKFTFPDDL